MEQQRCRQRHDPEQRLCCCSCMPSSSLLSSPIWNMGDKVPVPEEESLSACSSASEGFSVDDPVEHRLHCQVSDCVQCRCDSGYMPLATSISSCHRCGINRQGSRSKCPLITSSPSSNLPDAGSHHHPPSSPNHHKCCQYCSVCTLECSCRFCSDCKNLRRRRVSSASETPLSRHECSFARYSNPDVLTSVPQYTCPRWSFLLGTSIQRFMSYFSERLRRPHRRRLLRSSSLFHGWERMTSFLYTMITVATFCLSFLPSSDGCSSRSTPKPRPPSPTLRPNITIQTYTCPPEYDAHYCLNGATCFTVKIGESILYNCECAEGYMGQRCEFKDLDGSYLPAKQRAMLEQAGLTSSAAIIVVIVVIVCFYLYVRSRRKLEISQRLERDEPDGRTYMGYENERRPFSSYYYPNLSHNNHNHLHQPLPPQLSFQNPTNNANTTTTATSSTTYQHHQPQQPTQHHQQLPIGLRDPPETHHHNRRSESEDVPPLSPTVHSPPSSGAGGIYFPKRVEAAPSSASPLT